MDEKEKDMNQTIAARRGMFLSGLLGVKLTAFLNPSSSNRTKYTLSFI
jgi:hypothetical protein